MSNNNRSNTTAERGPFQVWQRSGDGFVPVALVHAGNLLAATVFTMNRGDGHWQDGEHVTPLVPDARSTNIGDVIVSPEGVAYRIEATADGGAFIPIDFAPYREQQALFAEWTQDYASARARDVRELFRMSVGGPKPQSESSRSTNGNDRDGGIEQ